MFLTMTDEEELLDGESLDDELLPEEALPLTGDTEGGLYEHRRVVADKGQSPMRVDKFLMDHLGDTSRNRIQKAAEAGFIQANIEFALRDDSLKNEMKAYLNALHQYMDAMLQYE